ncbi:MAG: AAA family ATPase [Chloroflexota bacterium]
MNASKLKTLDDIRALYGATKLGNVRCPAHDDHKASLSINAGANGAVLFRCHAGCKTEDILAKKGLTFADILPPKAHHAEVKKQMVKTYDYRGLDGALRSQTVRYNPKAFNQRRPDPSKPGAYLWNMDGVEHVPYRCPEVAAAINAQRTIYYVEGEKDADTLVKLGLEATCNQMGANKPKVVAQIARYFKDADVVIIPDNDPPAKHFAGQRHAIEVANQLHPYAHRVSFAYTPDRYKDVAEWYEAEGGDAVLGGIIDGITDTPPLIVAQAAPDLLTNDSQVSAVSSMDRLAQKYHLWTLADLEQRPPVAWLHTNELPAAAFAVLFGASGTGKSFQALDYALDVAKTAPVIYLAAEGATGLVDRIYAAVKFSGRSADTLRVIDSALPLLDASEVQAFIASVKPAAPKLIILDTLARCMIGGDENSSRDMGLVIEACDQIKRETGATVLVVHHTGKNGAGERGSSALRGAADMMIELTNDDGLITLTCSKVKDGEPFTPRYLRLIPAESRDGRTSCVLIPANKVAHTNADPLTARELKVLETLSLETMRVTGGKWATIKAVLGLHDQSLNRTLSSLMRRDFVRQGAKGDPYCLTDAGVEQVTLLTHSSPSTHVSDVSTDTNHSLTLTPPFRGVSEVSSASGANRNNRTTEEKATDRPQFGVTLIEQNQMAAFDKRRGL